MNTVQHDCVFNSRRPNVLNGVACVSQGEKREKKQATDAAHSGPGAGVRPHEWMDSCAGCFLQKNLLLSCACYILAICSCICIELQGQNVGTLRSKWLGIIGISPCLLQESTNLLLYSPIVDGVLLFNRPGRGCLDEAWDVLCKHFHLLAVAKTRASAHN